MSTNTACSGSRSNPLSRINSWSTRRCIQHLPPRWWDSVDPSSPLSLHNRICSGLLQSYQLQGREGLQTMKHHVKVHCYCWKCSQHLASSWEGILRAFMCLLVTFIIIIPTAEHLLGASSSHFPRVFPQMPMRRCHLSQREEPCLDPKLTKRQSLERSPGWPVSQTHVFIMFCFIA